MNDTAAPNNVTVDKILTAYMALRDKRSELKDAYEEADAVLKEKLYKLEVWMKQQMEALGTDQLASRGIGTAYREISRKYSASDWTLIWGYMREHERFDLTQKRLSEGILNEILKETGELPPGVSLHSEYVVIVRRK